MSGGSEHSVKAESKCSFYRLITYYVSYYYDYYVGASFRPAVPHLAEKMLSGHATVASLSLSLSMVGATECGTICFRWEVDKVWMSKFIAHEIEVALQSRLKCESF